MLLFAAQSWLSLAWASPEVGLESSYSSQGVDGWMDERTTTCARLVPAPVLALTWFLSTPHPGSGIGQRRLG